MSAREDLLAQRSAEELIPGDADAADAFAVTLRQRVSASGGRPMTTAR